MAIEIFIVHSAKPCTLLRELMHAVINAARAAVLSRTISREVEQTDAKTHFSKQPPSLASEAA
ncbi:MAG: hypothetical protein M2R45_00448 [Verrucomicrobia subdivision 3 bacterium]|nr:hypothetical protein [Limisphaerales bacterium]MCS1413672.1 hypothetical protein [Limisphaerales bacterium]